MHAERPHHGDRAGHGPGHARPGRRRRGGALAHPGDAQPVARHVGTVVPLRAPAAPSTPSSTPPGRTARPSCAADDGLRGRLPQVVEWKGTGRAPGDEVAPIDLRVDHVYLVSCKYLSNILFNVSPSSVFDSLLLGGPGRGGRMRAGDAARRRGLVRRGGARSSTRPSTRPSASPRAEGDDAAPGRAPRPASPDRAARPRARRRGAAGPRCRPDGVARARRRHAGRGGGARCCAICRRAPST